MKLRLAAPLAAWIIAFACGGCAWLTGGTAKDAPREIGPVSEGSTKSGLASGGPTIKSAELDELTRAFADRYVGLLSSACDALKKDNPDLVQRREAQELLVNGATNVYDIASNADAFTRVLDLIVVTTLTSQVWIDDDRATEVFADRADVLVRALHHGRVEAWALAAQVMRPDQLDLLDYMLWDWRRSNPDAARVYFVRFSNFAIGRGKSASAEVLAPFGFLANLELLTGGLLSGGGFLSVFLGSDPAKVGQAGKSVDEARVLSERMFYMLKRAPTLLRWQVVLMKDDALATPEVGKTLADVHRLTDQVEQLPKNFAAERQALLTALDARMDRADATVAGIKAAITEANQLVISVGRAGDSLKELLKTADVLFARHDSRDTASTAAASRPFDIREYTEATKELAATAGKVNDVLKSSNELLGSSEWNRRVQELNESVDERVSKAAEQSQQVVNNFFWRVYAGLGILFVILIVCLATAFVLMRRLVVRTAGNAAGPRPDGDHTANREAGPEADAGCAGREGGAE